MDAAQESHAAEQPIARSAAAASAAEWAAREAYGRLLAAVARRTGDIHAAEDALGEAFALALRTWPRDGVPDRPDAWLLVAAQRRAADAARGARARPAIALPADLLAPDDRADDDRLGLLFACAHPAIDPAVRTPLLLQCVLGVETDAIASAYLVRPEAMRQRLSRAKAKIREAGIRLEPPDDERLAERAPAVLDAIYAAFGLGYDDPAGPAVGTLDDEACHLAAQAAGLLPGVAEALGLAALLAFVHARAGARRDGSGAFVPLDRQDTARWDHAMIERAESMLRAASAIGPPGRYQLEAAIQSAHVDRLRTGRTGWGVIASMYDALLAVAPSMAARVASAAARLEASGPEAGLEALRSIGEERAAEYQPFFAVRGECLARAGRSVEAAADFRRAAGLSRDPAVRAHLLGRAGEFANRIE
jgi:RNA polymerase sigma-70 factor (ECF subfamily)